MAVSKPKSVSTAPPNRLHRIGYVLVAILVLLNARQHFFASIAIIEPSAESPTSSTAIAAVVRNSDSVTATEDAKINFYTSRKVDIHANDYIAKGKSCSVQWCQGVDARRVASVLYDGATGQ